jgi:hypothetical protein
MINLKDDNNLIELIENLNISKDNVDIKYDENLNNNAFLYNFIDKNYINNILKWINKNSDKINEHTFPKCKKAWINLIRTQFKERYIRFDFFELKKYINLKTFPTYFERVEINKESKNISNKFIYKCQPKMVFNRLIEKDILIMGDKKDEYIINFNRINNNINDFNKRKRTYNLPYNIKPIKKNKDM